MIDKYSPKICKFKNIVLNINSIICFLFCIEPQYIVQFSGILPLFTAALKNN